MTYIVWYEERIQHKYEEVVSIKANKVNGTKTKKNEASSVRRKTKIIIKEHFSTTGKSVSDIMTDILINKVKQMA